MKLARWLRLTTLTALGLGLGLIHNGSAAIATNFAATEVDPNRYVLLATPGGSRLTILEQISDTRACWQENGNEVDPLLLNFDFTGICGRYTDLNGYSVRTAGEDLGLLYRLQVRTEGNAMVLYAVPRRDGPALEIGRTNGLPSQYGQIYLNSGWRLTQRLYNGQTIGHVYLTSNQTEATLIANASNPSRPGSSVVTRPRPTNPVPVGDRPAPTPAPNPTVVRQPDPEPAPRRSRRAGSLLDSLFRIDINFSINPSSNSNHRDETNSREDPAVNLRLRNY